MTKSRKLDIFNKIYDFEYLLDPTSTIEENAHTLACVINAPIKAIIKIMLPNIVTFLCFLMISVILFTLLINAFSSSLSTPIYHKSLLRNTTRNMQQIFHEWYTVVSFSLFTAYNYIWKMWKKYENNVKNCKIFFIFFWFLPKLLSSSLPVFPDCNGNSMGW